LRKPGKTYQTLLNTKVFSEQACGKTFLKSEIYYLFHRLGKNSRVFKVKKLVFIFSPQSCDPFFQDFLSQKFFRLFYFVIYL